MAARNSTVQRGLVAVLLVFATAGLCLPQPHYTAHRPMAITACGQTADAVTVSLLSSRLHLDHVFDKTLTPERLQGIRTLVIVIGGSVQGLDETGTDERREVSRIKTLLARARQLAVGVIAVHVGGESRRGAASDQLIEAVIDQADYMIVTEAGNRDGLFTRAAREKTVPLVIVDEPADAGRELKAIVSDR